MGPFLVTITEENANPFLNYAIPDDDASPAARDVRNLVRSFARRGRRPRVEHIPVLAPDVAPALSAEGFTVEGLYPLMVCRPEDLGAAEAPRGFTIRTPRAPDELLAAVTVQHEAFEEPRPPSQADAERLAHTIERGGVVGVAVEDHTGLVVAAGSCDPVMRGLAEVSGIAVRVQFRRRGIAAALTRGITAQAFALGANMLFLTPGDESSRHSYERAGFHTVGEQAHMSLFDDRT